MKLHLIDSRISLLIRKPQTELSRERGLFVGSWSAKIDIYMKRNVKNNLSNGWNFPIAL